MSTDSAVVRQPLVTVVVASWCSETLLTCCLESIETQRHTLELDGQSPVEVIVATNLDEAVRARMQALFPATIGTCVAGATVTELRAVGAKLATGKLVAIIEDHVTVSDTWLQSLVAAHAAGGQVMGGPVDNGLRIRAYDWALYFAEYGAHIPPVIDGDIDAVSGVNVAYDLLALQSCRDVWRVSLQENEVNDALSKRGVLPQRVANALVYTHLPMKLSFAMQHLFQGGRHFGSYRTRGASFVKRILWLCASPAVIAVLMARIATRVATRAPARLGDLLRSAGYLLLLLGSWSLGEFIGYAKSLTGNDATRAAR